MKLAITGATGFLGTEVLHRLRGVASGVRCLVRRSGQLAAAPALAGALGLEEVVGDVARPNAAAALVEGCQALIHLAGLVSRDPADGPAMYRVHVEGTRHLLAAAAAAGVERVVLASTSGTIAVSDQPRVGTEADDYPIATVGRWPYYLSKIYQEKLALELCARARLPLVVLNPSLLLGPGDRRCSSVGDIWRFLQGDILALPSGGLSFVDVRDVADTVVAALERGEAGQRYLLGAENLTFKEFFDRLSRLADRPPPRLQLGRWANRWAAAGLVEFARWRGVAPRLDLPSVEMGEHFFYLDSQRARSALGFAPRDPQETLRDTVRDLQIRQHRGERLSFGHGPGQIRTSAV